MFGTISLWMIWLVVVEAGVGAFVNWQGHRRSNETTTDV